jgi:RNase P subunit RPR2
MRKQSMTERRFKCGSCGAIIVAYKSSSRRTAEGHIKTMWCPWCKEVKDFTQYKYNLTLGG